MLGLGLAVTVGKRILGGVIESLMSALRGRAEYSENNTDSKAVVKDIDNYELLDKATILLTPTATSDARVHSVKTYTGDELVTNGTFDTDSDWTKGTGWSIEDGKASCDGSTANLIQNLGSANKTYKLTFSILDYVSGYVRPSYVGLNSSSIDFSGNGTYSTYINSLSDLRFVFYGNSFNGSIDNVSVTEADADFDFDRASSATRINSDGLVQDMQSITDPELVLNGDFEELGDEEVTNGTFDADSDWSKSTGWSIADGVASFNTTTNGSITQSGYANSKTYKVSIDVVSYVRGNPFVAIGQGSQYTIPNSIGTHIIYVTSGSVDTILRIYSGQFGVGGEGSIDNVSIKQVDPNDEWNLGTGWSIEDGELVGDGTMTASDVVIQSYNFIDGNTYKFTFEITESSQGSVFIREPFNGGSDAVGTVGTHTFNYVAGAANELRLRSSDSFIGKIDNISIKDITFSTDVDLARINYDSNGDNGHILLEPTSTNLVTYSEDIDSLNDGDGEVGVNSTLTYESDVVAPDGSLGVYRIQNPATASTYLKVTNNTTAAQSMSVWVKAKTVGTNNQFTLYRDGTGGSTSDVETATGDWQRFEYSWSTVGSSAYFINNEGDTYASDLYIWGFQVENLPYATSYIPSLTGSTVTRATETLTGSGNSTLINSTEGVLYAEINALSYPTDLNSWLTITDGTASNSVGIVFETTPLIVGRVEVGGVNQAYLANNVDYSDFVKVAVKYKANDFALWINGVEVATDTSGNTFSANTLNSLQFSYGGGTNNWKGKCKALAVFNEALEDDELELLTGVTNYGSFGELASANGYTII